MGRKKVHKEIKKCEPESCTHEQKSIVSFCVPQSTKQSGSEEKGSEPVEVEASTSECVEALEEILVVYSSKEVGAAGSENQDLCCLSDPSCTSNKPNSVTVDVQSEEKKGKSGKPKNRSNKQSNDRVSHNKQITDYYPVRRSYRTTESEKKVLKDKYLKDCILSVCQDGLKVVEFDAKGRGVIATKVFVRGDFVVEYRGDLVDKKEAERREKEYNQDESVGSYMYYFKHKQKHWCVDATAESGHFGRLVNHSFKAPNCKMHVVEISGKPFIALVAIKHIQIGSEVLYDYGDRSKESVTANPWLINS